MKWLKEILSKSTEKSVEILLSQENKQNTNVLNFRGLDTIFIDLIYFKDNNEKDEYIKFLNSLFNSLSINNQITFTEAYDKLVAYDLNEPVDFIRDVILLPESSPDKNGINKLDNRATAFNFAFDNVNRKSDRGFFNFDFEDDLIFRTHKTHQTHDYLYISTMTEMGLKHGAANNKIKCNEYFNFVFEEKDLSTISPITVSGFFKRIGEYFITCSDFSNALKWYQAGLEINPNLGVKKKIIELINRNTSKQ